jgi:hypothetical protein
LEHYNNVGKTISFRGGDENDLIIRLLPILVLSQTKQF